MLLACEHEADLSVIKYLIEEFGIYVNHLNVFGENCLTLACKNNNISIIKYFIEDCSMDYRGTENKNSLMICCQYSSNLEIIKYFVEEHKINVNYKDNYLENCFDVCQFNKNYLQVAIYLIKNTNVEKSFDNFTFDQFSEIIKTLLSIKMKFVDLIIRLNELIDAGIKSYTKNDMEKCINDINPLLLNIQTLKSFDITFPYRDTFKNFTRNLDKLHFEIWIINNDYPLKTDVDDNIDIDIDFTEQCELLFKNNGLNYSGYKNIVYNEIIFFKEIQDIVDFSEVIVLDTKIPVDKYIMNLFIQGTYTKRINLNKIKPCDIMQFINLVDEYPTKSISFDKIEDQLIQYISKNNIPYDIYLIELINKYQLKFLYLHAHNSKFKL